MEVPKVRLAKPSGRPYQLRYTDPETKREVRISTSTRDEAEALEKKAKLEAKLLLGIDAKPRRRVKAGANMDWKEFRERYSEIQLSTLRIKSAIDAESRLDIAERILKPRTLADVANSEALHDLQAKLLAGAESKYGKRSPQTARNYLVAVLAALNWAAYMGWLPAVPKVKKLKVSKRRQMKGRPLTNREFKLMVKAVPGVVGDDAAPSWEFVLRGLWESGLRLDELMHVHWTNTRYIVPSWLASGEPVLLIPAAMQKNDTEEAIPLLPGFEALLMKTPVAQRFGWVFNPMSLQHRLGRRVRHRRPDAEWVGKIISRIGKAAGVVVRREGSREKFASAHDLRRSCAERLVSAGVPEREVSRVLRHADVQTTRRFYAPGTVQESATIIRAKLGVPRYNVVSESA